MHPLNEYIAGRGENPGRRELNRLIEEYGWFTTARRARALATGENDSALILPLGFWATVPPVLQAKNESAGAFATESGGVSPDMIINRFLEHGGYRIVPADGDTSAENLSGTAFPGDIDPELATEELAEIYRAQGLTDRAKEIYRLLSLRNPQKSIYFADIISRLESETTNN